MVRTTKHLTALAAVGVLALAACSSDSKSATSTTVAAGSTAASTPASTADTTAVTTAESTVDTTTGSSTADTSADTSADTTVDTTADTSSDTSTPATEAAPSEWAVDTSSCSDPAAASAPITGTLTIGSAMPLSVSPAAAAFAPVKDGFELYFKYANDNNLLPGVTLKPDVQDDQYDATLTPGVVSGLIDSGASIFSGIIGTANNEAVRDTLNSECIPQMLNLSGAPEWGDVANYPWTSGALVPYDIEAKIYSHALLKQIGAGGTVGMFTVNSEFGKTFADGFKAAAAADGLTIVDEQTIEETDSNPPTNQVGALAAKKPAAVVAVPLGAQCPTFLKEMQNAEASTPDWKPIVYQTNTCASRLLISLLAGEAGTGIYTSGNILDPQDPANADSPGVKTFTDAYNAAGLKGDIGTTAVGWTIAEVTTDILIKAAATGTLSRESIINASRNLTVTPSLARPGADYKMNGEADPYPFQTLQVEQWDNTKNAFTLIGDPDTSAES
ncbi:MAG: hypothetical protein JWN62_1385 [Acidimicrobiales bacterium]|nr:hypothetical protein [Acidimicrobiales bacterium]